MAKKYKPQQSSEINRAGYTNEDADEVIKSSHTSVIWRYLHDRLQCGTEIPKLSLNEVIKKQSIPSSTDLMADKSALPRSFQLAAPWRNIHPAKKSSLRGMSTCIHLNYIQQ